MAGVVAVAVEVVTWRDRTANSIGGCSGSVMMAGVLQQPAGGGFQFGAAALFWGARPDRGVGAGWVQRCGDGEAAAPPPGDGAARAQAVGARGLLQQRQP